MENRHPPGVSSIQWIDEKRSIRVGEGGLIRFTKHEYRIMLALERGNPVTDYEILLKAYDYAITLEQEKKDHRLLERHVKEIRKKLQGGIYIYCILRWGYMLHPVPAVEQSVQPAGVSSIVWNDEERKMKVPNGRQIDFTPNEYRIVSLFKQGAPIYERIAQELYGCSFNEKVQTNVEKFYDGIRSKLYGTGFNLYLVLGGGYILLPNPPVGGDRFSHRLHTQP